MNKKFFLALSSLLVITASIVITSCSSSPNPVDYVVTKGGIAVATIPTEVKAQIWLDGVNTNKITPDSVINLSAGEYIITLKRVGYYDTSFAVNVTLGMAKAFKIDMTANMVYKSFSGVKLYKSDGLAEIGLSALILSKGVSASIKADTNKVDTNKVDLFYFREGSELRSPTDISNYYKRKSYFLPTNQTDIYDGLSVPKLYQAGDSEWKETFPDSLTAYFYVYDFDGHYSKLKITTHHADSTWMEIQGLYNLSAGSTRFK